MFYEAINNQVDQGNQIELLAVNQYVPDDWMSFVYSSKTPKPSSDNQCKNKNEINHGFVYLGTDNGLSRKCLSLRKGSYVVYFDGAESEFIITTIDLHFDDTDGLQEYTKQFPNHFDSVYFNVIFEILEENLHQHLQQFELSI